MKLGRWITRTRLTRTPPFVTSAQPAYERGLHHMELGECVAAMQCFQHAAGIIPAWADPWRQLGDAAMQLRQPEDAVLWFETGLARNPADTGLRRGLLEALALVNPEQCASLLGIAVSALPHIATGPDAAWRGGSVRGIPQPSQVSPPSNRRFEEVNVTDLVRALELRARQWCYDNGREAARAIWTGVRAWRSEQAAALGCRGFHLDPEWISNIGNLGLIGVLLKFARLGLLEDSRLCLPPTGSGFVGNPVLLERWEKLLGKSPHEFTPAFRASAFTWDSVPLADGRTLALFEEAVPLAERLWLERGLPPLMSLTEEEKIRGRECLEQLGVPRDAWFVALHVRDRGFYGTRCDPGRWADIDTYSEAVAHIRSRGGWVVRLGDPSTKRAPRVDGLVDYAHSPHKNPWMDVFLLGQCRFFIGTNSGPAFVPPLFGVPCVFTNWFPFCLGPAYAGSLVLPKLYRHGARGRWLSFAECADLPMRMSFHAAALERAGLSLRDNSPREIREVVAQMLGQLESGPQSDAADDARHERLRPVMQKLGWAWSLRIGREFLREHEALLEPPASGAARTT